MEQKDTEYLVGGYRFSTAEEAELARQEKQRVTLLEVKLDYNNISSIAMLYEKAVRNQVFVTPIGINFLSKLQELLIEHDRPEGLLAIPVREAVCAEGDESAHKDKEQQAEVDSGQEVSTGQTGNEEVILEEHEPGTVRLSILVDNLEKQIEKKDKQMKRVLDRSRKSILLNVVLAAIIVILFVITLTGENANALNYKRVLTDRYASWEQQLSEREAAVRQREKELQLDDRETEAP